MIREQCKHFFEKSFRIYECAGRCLCPGRNGVASQRVLGHALHFDSRFALQNVPPPAECVGKLPHSDPTTTYSKYDSQTYSGADTKFVARLCRALMWGGRSLSSGLTKFLIRLSERSRNRTPLCSGNAGSALELVFRTLRRTQETPAARSAQRGFLACPRTF